MLHILSTIRVGAQVMMLYALAGCVPNAPPPRLIPTAEPFCAAVQTVCISKDDQITEGTAQSIEANNLGRAKVCKRQVKCAAEKPTS